MNIALLASHFNTGGITSYLLTLSRGLAAAGHRVTIISDGGNCESQLCAEVAHMRLDIRVKSEAHPKVILALPRLVRLIKEQEIDLCHAHTRVTQVLAAMAEKWTGVPHISTAHGFFRPRLFRRLFPCWGRHIIAVSNGVKEHLERDFKIDPSRIVLIPNGIDVTQFLMADEHKKTLVRQEWGINGQPVLGIIARLSSVKGIDILINAMPLILASYPQARLWIVGDGPQKEKLVRLVKTRSLSDYVRFESIVKRTAEILPAFDVFVLPSLQEGLGLSVLEAQAVGVPVVASNVGGLPDLISDGQTGLLVAPGRCELLAEKIMDMIKNPLAARAMAVNARAQVEQKFSQSQMVKHTLNLYQVATYEQNTRR